MQVSHTTSMTKDAFLHWASRQEQNHEFVRGVPVALRLASRRHGDVAGSLLVALQKALSGNEWNVLRVFAVDVGASIRSPDVVLEPAGGAGSDVFTNAPVLLREVLSPSSLETDLHEKADEYTALPSLHAYVVLAQDEPRLWLWQRGEDGVFPKAGEMIEGAEAVLKLPSLGVELLLADIYRGVG